MTAQPVQDETLHALDASALLAQLHDEPGAGTVEAALASGIVSSVNWSEVVQKSNERSGKSAALLRSTFESAGLRIIPFGPGDAEQAAALWPATRHLGLSLADRASLALAQRTGATVLTADRTWATLWLGINIHPIR